MGCYITLWSTLSCGTTHTCRLCTCFPCQSTKQKFGINGSPLKSLNHSFPFRPFHSSSNPDASLKWTVIHRGASSGNKQADKQKQTNKLCHMLQHPTLCVMCSKITAAPARWLLRVPKPLCGSGTSQLLGIWTKAASESRIKFKSLQMHHLTLSRLPSADRHADVMQLMDQMKLPAEKIFALCWESS